MSEIVQGFQKHSVIHKDYHSCQLITSLTLEMFHYELLANRPIVLTVPYTIPCLGCLSNTWEGTDSTVTLKWKQLYANGC
jgi:hypothetical protein